MACLAMVLKPVWQAVREWVGGRQKDWEARTCPARWQADSTVLHVIGCGATPSATIDLKRAMACAGWPERAHAAIAGLYE